MYDLFAKANKSIANYSPPDLLNFVNSLLAYALKKRQ